MGIITVSTLVFQSRKWSSGELYYLPYIREPITERSKIWTQRICPKKVHLFISFYAHPRAFHLLFFFLADEWVQLIKAACWVKVCIRVEAVNTALCSLSSPMPHLHPLLPRSSYKAPGSSRQQRLTKAEQSRLAPVGIWWMKERHEKAKAPKGWETCVNVLSRFCRVWLFATSWTIACQAPNLAWIKTVGGWIRPQVCLVQCLGRVSVQSPCMPTRLRMTNVAVVLTRSDFAESFFF